MDSYHEISPSGTGIKIIAKTSRKRLPGDKSGRKNGDYEIYIAKRYFTITGWNEQPKEIREIDDVIDEIFALIVGDDPAKKTKAARSPENECASRKPTDAEPVNDEIIIEQVKLHKKGQSLWEGQTSTYKSESEADLALCGLISRYTEDEGQVDRIFRGVRTIIS